MVVEETYRRAGQEKQAKKRPFTFTGSSGSGSLSAAEAHPIPAMDRASCPARCLVWTLFAVGAAVEVPSPYARAFPAPLFVWLSGFGFCVGSI